MKVDENGNIDWQKTYGGSGWDGAYAVKQIPTDGGYIVAGQSFSGADGDKTQANKGDCDYWIIRLDSNGNKLWDSTIGGSNWDAAYSIAIANDDGYIIAGISFSEISGDKTDYHRGNGDYWIVKISTNGAVLWDKTFGGSNDEYLFSITSANTNGYIVAGSSSSGLEDDKTEQGYGNYDYWIVKIDNNGNKIWDKVFGGSLSDQANSIVKTEQSYIICGTSWSDASGNKTENKYGYCDYWVVKIDENGNKLWDKTIGATNLDLAYSIYATTDGGYVVAGESWSDASEMKSENRRGECDWWIVKFIGALTPPQLVIATKGTYTNKIEISWSAVAGASDFSTPDYGYKGPIGPAIFVNNKIGTVKVSSPLNITLAIKMMNLTQYLGTPVDWWCVAYSRKNNLWFYCNNALTPVPFTRTLQLCQPIYQGPLFNTPMVTLYNGKLGSGTYDVWFGIDYPMDGVLDISTPYIIHTHAVIVAE